MENKNILTREGLKELNIELKNLVEVDRPKVIADIKEARALGDLSENAEFDAARERQGKIEDRIQEIENIIANSKVTSSTSSSKVTIGSKVKIENVKTKKEEEFIIVGTLEADPSLESKKISNISPMGKALIGKSANDVVSINIDLKNKIKTYDVKIKSIQ